MIELADKVHKLLGKWKVPYTGSCARASAILQKIAQINGLNPKIAITSMKDKNMHAFNMMDSVIYDVTSGQYGLSTPYINKYSFDLPKQYHPIVFCD